MQSESKYESNNESNRCQNESKMRSFSVRPDCPSSTKKEV